ncbi:MAG: LolA family protein [Planctomycetota bacterium]|jgi:hypothetical protein
MKDNERQFEDFVARIKFDDTADPNHRDRLERDLLSALKKGTARQGVIWRTIMKSQITKVAGAAAVILIAVLAIPITDKLAAPAWAIDQTIDALSKFNAIHFSGTVVDEHGNETTFEAWARADSEQTAADCLRMETTMGKVQVVWQNRGYEYDPQTQIVYVTESCGPPISPWLGARLLEFLKEFTIDWDERYGKDAATGRERVFVTCSHPAAPDPRSWWFEFDVESKLPVSLKQWENMTRQGPPKWYARSITYLEDLPDELFDFKIPESAEVVAKNPMLINELGDPNTGMLVGDMTEQEACEEIVRRYWSAVIEGKWEIVALLHPTASAESWRRKYSRSPEELVETGTPYQEEGCSLARIVPCTLRFAGSAATKIYVVVLLRQIDGEHSCVIARTCPSGSG